MRLILVIAIAWAAFGCSGSVVNNGTNSGTLESGRVDTTVTAKPVLAVSPNGTANASGGDNATESKPTKP